MKLLVTGLLIAAQMVLGSVAHASVGGHGGNGGGGIYENGQYKTFFQTQLIVNPIPKSIETLPSLSKLIRFISASPYLTTEVKTRLLKVILPAQNRNYFDVAPDHFSVDVSERIKAEYERATQASATKIVLYAVTDTNSGNTYLLPNFYRLSERGQMAILFHEATWILNPNSSYSQIIGAEVTFQAHLEQPSDFTSAQRFVRLVGGAADQARFAYNWDLKTGAITADGRIVEGSNSLSMTLANLTGNISENTGVLQLVKRRSQQSESVRLQTHLISLSLAYPHSRFLGFFREAAMNAGVAIYLNDVTWDESDQYVMKKLTRLAARGGVMSVDESEGFSLAVDSNSATAGKKRRELGNPDSRQRGFDFARIVFKDRR